MAKGTTYALIGLGIVALGALAIAGAGMAGAFDVDLTGKSPKHKRKSTRKWSKIKGITLHQVGVSNMGAKAWPRVTSHLGVHTDGTVVLIHPLRSYLYASHGLNRDTVAIEVAGNFLSDPNNPNSYWKKGGGPDRLSSAQEAGLRKAIAYIIGEVADNGGEIERIYAHRQSSADRAGDPGAEIWDAGGIWAQRKFGLSDGGPSYKRGSGKPIPPWWDPRYGEGVAANPIAIAEEVQEFTSEAEGDEFPDEVA